MAVVGWRLRESPSPVRWPFVKTGGQKVPRPAARLADRCRSPSGSVAGPLREALARSDFDAVRRSPASAKARRPAASGPRAQGRGKTKHAAGIGSIAAGLLTSALALVGGLLLTLAQLALKGVLLRPVSVIGGLLAVSLSAAIIVNAVSMQEGQHPSPLFGGQTATEKPAVRAVQAPSQPQVAAPPAVAPTPVARPAAAAQPATPPAPKPAAAPPANDPIAHLLATGAPPAAAKTSDTGLLGVQKALVKLGYGITADGLNGPATRRAVSEFEKLEGLPITGDPTNVTMRKALSVASGITLD